MKITFLIGNGFDLRLGMKTRYCNVYDEYIKTDSTSGLIAGFKKALSEDKPNEYSTWADFEMAMGEYSESFDNADDFVQCVRDFKSFMASYLEAQQKTFWEHPKNRKMIADEMQCSLEKFYMGQNQNVITHINALKSGTIEYSALNFNYTKMFESLASSIFKEYKYMMVPNVIHVHGKLGNDIVLGVDNLTQIKKEAFHSSRKVQRAFVKPVFNEMYDSGRIAEAKKLISNSDVICIYGMSLGESDLTWRKAIIDWLNQSCEHHLIYYVYSEKDYDPSLRDEIMDVEDEEKEKLLGRMGIEEKDKERLLEQVHIPVGYDIFDFKSKIEEDDRNRAYITAHSEPIVNRY